MSKKFKSKLASFSALVTSLLLVEEFTDAQIVFTDIFPDDTLHFNQSHQLDLNNDGQVDFRFGYFFSSEIGATWSSQSWFLYATQYNGNEIMGNASSIAFALLINDTINKQQSWIDNFPLAFLGRYSKWNSCESSACSNTNYGTHTVGPWQNLNNGFVGLKLVVNSDTLYGWVRLDVSIMNKVIIKDYAFDSIPNETIIAGEGSIPTAIENTIDARFQVFPNPASNSFQLNYTITSLSHLTVSDDFGRIVKDIVLDASANNITISTLEFPSGVYLLTLKSEDKRVSKKLVVEK